MDIHRFLNYLGALFPLTPNFSYILSKVIHDQSCVHKQKLLEPPARAVNAWFLLSGIVSASIFDKQGREVVIRLYLPEAIFTDLNSFLFNKPSSVRLRVIDSANLQFISLKDFRQRLLLFAETQGLKDQMMLKDQQLDQQRSSLISLPAAERFSEFTAMYPMAQIPNVVGASFLNLGTTKYCKLKAAWNAENKG